MRNQGKTITRRKLLTATAATAALAPLRQEGPHVWLEMDQKELDDAYSQSVYAANLQQIVRRYATNSEVVRERLGPPERLAYGTEPIESLDVYRTDRPEAPVQVFIHGGAWQQGSAKSYGFPAETFVHAGPTGSCPTSAGYKTSAIACCRWPIKCVARWHGCTRTP